MGHGPLERESRRVQQRLLLPPPPVAVAGYVARVSDLDVNPASTSFPLVGSLAACGIELLVLVCRRRFRQRRDKRDAVILHALSCGRLVRRFRHLALVVCSVQALRRGRVAVCHYRYQQLAGISACDGGREFCSPASRLLSQVVRVQSRTGDTWPCANTSRRSMQRLSCTHRLAESRHASASVAQERLRRMPWQRLLRSTSAPTHLKRARVTPDRCHRRKLTRR